MLEYLLNNYVLSLIGVFVSLLITYLYDKFEKKQYTSATYIKIAVLVYIACLAMLFSFKYVNKFLSSPADFESIIPKGVNTVLENTGSIPSVKDVVSSSSVIDNVVKTTSFSNPASVSVPQTTDILKNVVSLDNQKFNIGTPTF